MVNKFPGIIVPAYSDPTRDDIEWDRLENAAGKLKRRLIVIANPHDGPGAAVRQDYLDRINKLRELGAKVIGYVYTCHGVVGGPARRPCPRPLGAISRM